MNRPWDDDSDLIACCVLQFQFPICAWHRVSNPKGFSISVLLLQLRIEIYCKTMERQVIIDHGSEGNSEEGRREEVKRQRACKE